MKKKYILAIIIAIIILIILKIVFFGILKYSDKTKDNEITNFQECIQAGNPAMESYPKQCKDPISDQTFTEVIDDAWRLDNITLMQHKTEGYFACFGCGIRLCIDPIMEMKPVEESQERYCTEEFEVIE